MYNQLLHEHYTASPYRGTLPDAHFSSRKLNPSCGDEVTMMGRVASGILTHIRFTGVGCVISQAAASLIAEAFEGKELSVLQSARHADVENLLGITLGPVRLRCAELPLQSLKEGIAEYLKNKSI